MSDVVMAEFVGGPWDGTRRQVLEAVLVPEYYVPRPPALEVFDWGPRGSVISDKGGRVGVYRQRGWEGGRAILSSDGVYLYDWAG